jgi:hypothetical protein
VPALFLIAIVAVLVGIFFAATGRGGELAYEQTDHAPVDLGPVSAADIALLRPPTAMWGYNMQVTDEALDNIARAMRGRDVTIAFLQEHLATLTRNGAYVEPQGAPAHQDLAPGIPSFPEASQTRWDADVAEVPEILESPQAGWDADVAEVPEVLESPQAHWDADVAEVPETLESPQARWDTDIAEAPETADTPVVADSAEPPQTPNHPRTPLVLRASPAKTPPAPGPDNVTQPSETLQDPEAHEVTQPSETLAPHEPHGPQGSFNTHDWWAEQEEAAREEAARRAAGPSGVAGDDSPAAAEEQG